MSETTGVTWEGHSRVPLAKVTRSLWDPASQPQWACRGRSFLGRLSSSPLSQAQLLRITLLGARFLAPALAAVPPGEAAESEGSSSRMTNSISMPHGLLSEGHHCPLNPCFNCPSWARHSGKSRPRPGVAIRGRGCLQAFVLSPPHRCGCRRWQQNTHSWISS